MTPDGKKLRRRALELPSTICWALFNEEIFGKMYGGLRY